MARVAKTKKRFGSCKFCSVNDFAVPNFIPAEPKFHLSVLGPSEKVVRTRVKMVRVPKKSARLV